MALRVEMQEMTASKRTVARVLVVDDEREVRELLVELLGLEQIDASAVATGQEALDLIQRDALGSFDLVLLDIGLEGGLSGWDVMERLRAAGDQTPIICVTGLDARGAGAKALRMGADDFVAKPFDREELAARIDAVIRRSRTQPVVRIGDVKVDLGRRIVERNDRRLDLSPREFDLLQALIDARGEPVSRADLLESVWGGELDPQTNVVEMQIARLRRKLGREGSASIETLVGIGYRLVVESD